MPDARAEVDDELGPVEPLPAEEPEENVWSQHPLLLEAHLGVATPVGALGATLEYSPIEHVSLVCGAGTNLHGLQTECMARGRSFFVLRPNAGFAGYVGAGASMGTHEQTKKTNTGLLSALLAPLSSAGHDSPDESVTSYVWERAVWANFELGVEARGLGGALRAYLGVAWMQNFQDGERQLDGVPEEEQGLDGANDILPYGGLAIGVPLL